MEREQRISLCIDDYKNENEFWDDVAALMDILTKNGKYECVFRYEDCGVYIIEFCYNRHLGYGTPYAVWLTEDEYDSAEMEG